MTHGLDFVLGLLPGEIVKRLAPRALSPLWLEKLLPKAVNPGWAIFDTLADSFAFSDYVLEVDASLCETLPGITDVVSVATRPEFGITQVTQATSSNVISDISSEINPSDLARYMYLPGSVSTPADGVSFVGPSTTIVTVPFNGMLDMIFVFDTTGSMADDIAAAQDQATNIVAEVTSRVTDYQMGLVTYRDHPFAPFGNSGDWAGRMEQDFTADTSALIDSINAISVAGGNDWSESVYSGLMTAIEMSWRDGANKKIVLIGDAPPHDPEPVTGYTMAEVLQAAYNVDPANIYPILVGSDPEAAQYFAELAEGSSGELFAAANADEVVDAILAAIEQIVSEQPTAQESVTHWPPPPAIPACNSMGAIPNTIVLADVPENAAPGRVVFCRVLAAYGSYTGGASSANIGHQGVVDQGVIHSVDILALGTSNVPQNGILAAPTTVCLRGTGRLIFLSSQLSPRVPSWLESYSMQDFTCAPINETGTLTLVGEPLAPTPLGQESGCPVTTTARLNLRAEPSLEGEVFAVLPFGTTLTAQEWRDGWYHVSGPDGAGWVNDDYVTATNCGLLSR